MIFGCRFCLHYIWERTHLACEFHTLYLFLYCIIEMQETSKLPLKVPLSLIELLSALIAWSGAFLFIFVF